MLFMWSVIFLGIILLPIIILLALQFYNILFLGFAPFISTHHKIIKRVAREIETYPEIFSNRETVYELGCGRADFLRMLEKKALGKKLIGIEYFFFPCLLSKIQAWFTGSRIKILKKDFFDVNLGEANLVYCYLNVATMKKLKTKFSQECRPGTILISSMFSLPDAIPFQTVRENRYVIYFYKF